MIRGRLKLLLLVLGGAGSLVTAILLYKQFQIDSSPQAVLTSDGWPLKSLGQGSTKPIYFTVHNTSKENLTYYFRVTGNGFCAQEGINKDPGPLSGCYINSQPTTLGKVGSDVSAKRHVITVEQMLDRAHPSLDPQYFLQIDVMAAETGATLLSSRCYYDYDTQNKQLDFYAPLIDTSRRDEKLQAECFTPGTQVTHVK